MIPFLAASVSTGAQDWQTNSLMGLFFLPKFLNSKLDLAEESLSYVSIDDYRSSVSGGMKVIIPPDMEYILGQFQSRFNSTLQN